MGALEQHQVFRPIEQRIERPTDDAIQIHAHEPLAEGLGCVLAEHDETPKAIRLPWPPCRLNVLELSRWINPLDVRRQVGFSRYASEPMFHPQVTADHISPDVDVLGLVTDATFRL
jgi:hypothetical protein